MLTRVHGHTRAALLVSLALLLPAGGFAAPPSDPHSEPIAHLTTGTISLDWQSSTVHESIQLTIVAPDGTVMQKNFADGSNPSFRLQDVPKASLADGTYTYELRQAPKVSADLQRQLAAARIADDDAQIASIMRANGLGTVAVQSGVFTVIGGTIVSPNLVESKSTAAAHRVAATATSGKPGAIGVLDQVVADDQIVQGSLCVGLDCVDGESFGFDTIRLKENNLQIDFQDTSASVGFPTNDWLIQANDSTSGGASRMSIVDVDGGKVPFTVRAGAPTNSLYVDPTGRLGLRTATPVLDVHVLTGNTPAMRYEQDGSGGFTAQTWDIGANEANFFVRDVTGGSRLPLRIRPGAPTSSVDINASGNVGIGSASASARLYVNDSTQFASRITLAGQEYYQPSNQSTDGIAILLGVNRPNNKQLWIADSANVGGIGNAFRISPDSGDFSVITYSTSGVVTPADMRLQAAGGRIGIGKAPTQPIDHVNGAYLSTGGVWTNASSRALKHDIVALSSDEAKCALEELNPVKYAYNAAPDEHHVGFIAEDVPALVATNDRKSLSPMDVVAVLTKVVQEQQQTIDALSQRLQTLEKAQH
jgi:hypothetical protein